MVLNAAVQMIREAEELKQSILKFKSDTSMLQERSLWSSQQQLQKIYQKVLVLDLDYALDKKVEQDLWNVGFKQQIEALQAISKDRKNPLRGEAQAMLSWVLQAAGGFYLGLLHQICTAFKLDLPFRRRASLLGWVEGWSPGAPGVTSRLPPPAAARYICQHCLVHLGDLARYRQQPRVAYTFYRHALVVSTHSGQPYNQLGLLARRRGRRLGALYWHVRAVLVRAPFPPAPNNLLRTLQQQAGHVARDQPVLPGMRRPGVQAHNAPTARLDAHAFVTEFMRALYMIHTLENLEFASTLVDTLSTSLTALVATDCFESMTLIKMVCVIIWLVHTSTEELTVSESALSAAEATAAALSQALAAGALLALLLPSHTAEAPPTRALPALKVCLQWVALHPQLLGSTPFLARPQLWHALAHTLNKLKGNSSEKYHTVPLPEDEELHGFQPLEQSFKDLKFANHATWDTYGRRVPGIDEEKETDEQVAPPSVVSPACLSDPELEAGVRAHRLIELGKRLSELRPEQFTYTTEDSVTTFSALCLGGEQLSQALAELQAAAVPKSRDEEPDSEDDAPLPAPVVISEADFREKVRDKRVGILKPQGSLERAREERALAFTDDQDAVCDDVSRGDSRREARRPRVNIAMAAILRKQDESSKQVKFRTPPPVPEETEAEPSSTNAEAIPTDKPKNIQQKPVKSLSDIPVGRKTGGILALKDKSGYPHLVNVAEPTIRKEEKPRERERERDPKLIQPPPQAKRDQQSKWQQNYEPRQRNYGLHNAGISYNPNYQAPATVTSQNIRLSVVNPKEIDVRTAALQKQNARTDYQQRPTNLIRNDKKSFMDDLPPRFANQRWNQEQDDNKFKDNLFSTPPPNWLNQLPPPLPPMHLQSSMSPRLPLQSQMSMPPPMNEPYPTQGWWKTTSPYNTPVSSNQAQVQALQQLYTSQLSSNAPFAVNSYNQMHLPRPESMSPPYLRQSPIGQQLAPRHISPQNFSPYPTLSYPNIFDTHPQYQSRGFLDEVRYQQPLDQMNVGIDMTTRSLDPFVPSYEVRLDEATLVRSMDESLEPSPLDLSKTAEHEQGDETPPEDPGTYSLFSGAPGACEWGQVTHNQQNAKSYYNWEVMSKPPLPSLMELWAAKARQAACSERTRRRRSHPYQHP